MYVCTYVCMYVCMYVFPEPGLSLLKLALSTTAQPLVGSGLEVCT